MQYDPARLPGCPGSLNSGPARTLYVAGFSSTGQPPRPTLRLSEPGEFAVWFQVTNRWGCSAYDSNLGRNFRFQVRAAR